MINKLDAQREKYESRVKAAEESRPQTLRVGTKAVFESCSTSKNAPTDESWVHLVYEPTTKWVTLRTCDGNGHNDVMKVHSSMIYELRDLIEAFLNDKPLDNARWVIQEEK